MNIYPAIDLKDGKCVRLLHGLMDKATIFANSPAEQAALFAKQGSQWLHIVDLNGAFEGKAVNGDAVKAILASTKLKIQLGGGIRTLEQAEYWIKQGVSRIILGTAAVKDPDFARNCCREFPNQVAIGLDSNHGLLAIAGWAEQTKIKVIDLALSLVDSGAAALIHTDIATDGAMTGINLSAMVELATSQTLPVIASGGVTAINDVQSLKDTGIIEGVIIGRALYEGRVDLAQALAIAKL